MVSNTLVEFSPLRSMSSIEDSAQNITPAQSKSVQTEGGAAALECPHCRETKRCPMSPQAILTAVEALGNEIPRGSVLLQLRLCPCGRGLQLDRPMGDGGIPTVSHTGWMRPATSNGIECNNTLTANPAANTLGGTFSPCVKVEAQHQPSQDLREGSQNAVTHISASSDTGIACRTITAPEPCAPPQRSFSAPNHLRVPGGTGYLAERSDRLQGSFCPGAHLAIWGPPQHKHGSPSGTELSLEELRIMVRALQFRCFEHFRLPRPRLQTDEISPCAGCSGLFIPVPMSCNRRRLHSHLRRTR